MAITQAQIDALIQFIDETETAESVTNVIVAAILLFMNNKIKHIEGTVATSSDLEDEAEERQEADTILQQNIDRLSNSINTLVGGNVSEAIDSFNEVISFLAGVNDDETLLGKLLELKNEVGEASNKTDKDPVTGRLVYSQIPRTLLASMGKEYDGPVAYIPMTGDIYFQGGLIFYQKSNNTPVPLGEPVTDLIYCNRLTDVTYRWTGSRWKELGNSDIRESVYNAIKTNVNTVSAKVDEMLQDLAALAYNSSTKPAAIGQLTWPDDDPTILVPYLSEPAPGSTVDIGTLNSDEDSKSTTIHIKGGNLTKDIVLSVSGEGFSVSRQSITASQGNNGIDVTVTYHNNGTGDGQTKTGSLSIVSDEVNRTITLAAKKAVTTLHPAITVNPQSLSFDEIEVNDTATRTFTVQGSDLTSGLIISSSGSSAFAVSPSLITAEQASAGATVTVTYHPIAAGSNSCLITIQGGGAEPKSVAVSGTATNSSSPQLRRQVSFNLTNLIMKKNGTAINFYSVDQNGTFSGVLEVTDSSAFDLPESIEVSGSYGTMSYSNTTGAVSIQNITSDITISASAKAKEQTSALKIVRGWTLAEDKYLRDLLLGTNDTGVNPNNQVLLTIPNVTAGTSDTHLWYRPRQPFRASDGWALNSHAIQAGSAKDASSQYSTTGIYIAPNTMRRDLFGFGNGGSQYDDQCSKVCYTDYIPIPVRSTTGTLALNYMHGNMRDQRISSFVNDKVNIFVAGLVVYQKSGNNYIPVYAKSCQGADANNNGNYRQISIKVNSVCNISGSTYTVKENMFVRASFRMSDVPTKAEAANAEDEDWAIDANCYLKLQVGSTVEDLFVPEVSGERTYQFVQSLDEPYEQYDGNYAVQREDVTQ